MGRLRSFLEAVPKVWFLAEHEVPVRHSTDKLPPATDFPGLIFYHEVDAGDGTPRLFSYWETVGDFEASRGELEEKVGALRLARRGFLRRFNLKKPPFWGRPYTLLLHAIAVLGALSALEKHYAWLFEKPAVVLDLPSNDPLNLLDDQPLATELIIKNARASVETEARITSASLLTLDGQTAQSLKYPQGPHSILAGERLEFPMRGGRLPRGTYRLDVKIMARSGLLQPAEEFSLEREVRFWSKNPHCRFLSLGNVGKRKVLRGMLYVGRDIPEGLDCLATLEREAGMKFEQLSFPEVPQWRGSYILDPGREVADLSWTTSALTKYSETPFGVYLSGTPRSNWEDILTRLKIVCSKRSGSESRP